MDNPVLRGYTQKVQPLIHSHDNLRSAVILITCITLAFALCLIKGCVVTPAPAEEITLKASWYSVQSLKKEGAYKYSKGVMANGEIFKENDFTCATRLYKLGSVLNITNLANGKTVQVRVSDKIGKRFATKRIDLSKGAFSQIANLKQGIISVKVEVIS